MANKDVTGSQAAAAKAFPVETTGLGEFREAAAIRLLGWRPADLLY